MKRTHETLRDVGEALFGPFWQTEMAKELDVAVRTVQRWTVGSFNVPEGVWGEIAVLCSRRAKALDRWADKLGHEPL